MEFYPIMKLISIVHMGESILDRVVKGDMIDAITLVKQYYGYSTTDAKKFVDELTDNLPNCQSDQ